MPPEDLDRLVERMVDGSEQSRRQFIRHLAGAGLLVGPGRDVSLAWDPVHTFVVQRQETTNAP